ncbi:hypothetical protein CNMCM8980_001383 [Aspergillus fumigatiaffinis]|uniref:Uncharacterized protein n=1 Tax=Aspergillus fumigatiaffinis TaxID=340414 RepID=A0A8H4H4T2_9EURO|nr:hypothetical protein CNMCM5878_004200 [Aspergillus fumigatiaffinis]KAF4235314.1 hypothetical protein CNMCM6457_003115 [Aspergillus fumigatiaffinis]KAF4240244.1 hypothetical protein CNMCM8980_001383 [Aspergillus fumigatiaffinis]KAF4241175.1 hypothetical protein CNMCM6805_004335 [Aspergillus fumigatiaffinis]
MATQMASVINSGSATARQPAAASGSSGRNPDRNNGDRRGPGEGKVKKAKKKGQWCVLCRRWGHDAAKCRVGARVMAAVAAASQNPGHPPPPPSPSSPPRPRGWQDRPRMDGPNSRERRRERRRLQQQTEEDQQRQVQGEEDERDQRVDSPQGEKKDTAREADHQ